MHVSFCVCLLFFCCSFTSCSFSLSLFVCVCLRSLSDPNLCVFFTVSHVFLYSNKNYNSNYNCNNNSNNKKCACVAQVFAHNLKPLANCTVTSCYDTIYIYVTLYLCDVIAFLLYSMCSHVFSIHRSLSFFAVSGACQLWLQYYR